MTFWTRLREHFSFLPAVLCVVAAVLAESLIALDRRVDQLDLGPFAVLVQRIGASGSRDLLGAIAGSILTVAATTFSITIAVLALASSTYGPRLVRSFMTDRGNQFVLGVYVSTFLYSLLVLRSVQTAEQDGQEAFVPHLAVNVAVLLAVLSIGVLVYFIHHISDSVQVWTLARDSRRELLVSVERLYPEQFGRDATEIEDASGADDVPGRLEDDGVHVRSHRTGYVQSIDEDRLFAATSRHDIVVSLLIRPGNHVNDGAALAVVWPPDHTDDEVLAKVRETMLVGRSRSPHQDVEFAVMVLEEMAVRALSPATNDPYTAINALDDLSAGLVRMAGRRTPSSYRYDAQGRLRVCAPRVVLTDLLDRVIDAMRLYALAHPSVLHRTLALVEQVGTSGAQHEVRTRLAVHVDRVALAFEASSPQACDLDAMRTHADRVHRSLGTAHQ